MAWMLTNSCAMLTLRCTSQSKQEKIATTFDIEYDKAIKQHNAHLEDVLSAIANDEFVLYYQPKV